MTSFQRVVRVFDFIRSAPVLFRKETGQSLTFWALIALFNGATQVVFRRELTPGEFGTFNTTLGIIGLATLPLLALSHAFKWYPAVNHSPEDAGRMQALQESEYLVTETVVWVWGVLAIALLFFALPLLDLPRFSLNLFTFLNVLITLGGFASAAICRNNKQTIYWALLLFFSIVVRLVLGAELGKQEPWAESALGAFLVAAFILLGPAFRQPLAETAARIKALRTAWNRDFVLYFAATFSVTLGIFLFTSADRIVSQSWFGVANNNNMGLVDWPTFDNYQVAGLIARALLWGTYPILLVLLAQRSRLKRTTPASLIWFWIYLGALSLGVVLLFSFHESLSRLFCGPDYATASHLIPLLVIAMVPLGLLQGLGIFSLASRRYPECFLLGVCSLGYTTLLYCVGRQPQLMAAYMFGGGLVALMIVLFFGIVRWGRTQP